MFKRCDLIVGASAIALLLAIIIPAIQFGRESARQSHCVNSMRQLCLALENYHTSFSALPAGTVGSPSRPPEHRWSYYPNLTPYLSQAAEPPINYIADSRDSKNWPLAYEVTKHETFTVSLRPPLNIICPNGESDFGEHSQVFASYVGVTGVGSQSPEVDAEHEQAGVWGYNRRLNTSKIEAKLDNTLLFIETAFERDVWLFGGWPTIRWISANEEHQIGVGKTFGGFHPDFAVSGMVDTSVKKLSTDIDRRVFVRMAQINSEAD